MGWDGYTKINWGRSRFSRCYQCMCIHTQIRTQNMPRPYRARRATGEPAQEDLFPDGQYMCGWMNRPARTWSTTTDQCRVLIACSTLYSLLSTLYSLLSTLSSLLSTLYSLLSTLYSLLSTLYSLFPVPKSPQPPSTACRCQILDGRSSVIGRRSS
jgi:hypothetical protein